MDPSKRFATVVLAIGTVVLLSAIGIGQHMGFRLLGQSTELSPSVLPTVLITPEPMYESGSVYGPDWRRSQTLSAAPDPGFPDPRVPPVPLPTRLPPPTPRPRSSAPTLNPNVPVWRQTPIPTAAPGAKAGATPKPS